MISWQPTERRALRKSVAPWRVTRAGYVLHPEVPENNLPGSSFTYYCS